MQWWRAKEAFGHVAAESVHSGRMAHLAVEIRSEPSKQDQHERRTDRIRDIDGRRSDLRRGV